MNDNLRTISPGPLLMVWTFIAIMLPLDLISHDTDRMADAAEAQRLLAAEAAGREEGLPLCSRMRAEGGE